MRGRLLHTINSLALSVTCGDTLPLLSLRDIFPRPGEVFPQRGSQGLREASCLSLWERWHHASDDGEGETGLLI